MKGVCSVAEEFDEKACSYETNRLADWYRFQGEEILKVLAPSLDGVILDIGCGTGWLLRQILKTRPRLEGIGIDVSGRMIDVARQKASEECLANVRFVKGDWESQNLSEIGINLDAKPVRVVVCVSAFHYFAHPSLAARKICRCLDAEGQFFLLDRAKERSLLTTFWDYLHRTLIRDHVRFYRETELCQLLKDAGFAEVQMVSRIEKYLWKGKLYTSLILLSARKQAGHGSASALMPEREREPLAVH